MAEAGQDWTAGLPGREEERRRSKKEEKQEEDMRRRRAKTELPDCLRRAGGPHALAYSHTVIQSYSHTCMTVTSTSC